MLTTKTVYIGIGSNLGDRALNITNAIARIEERIGNIEKRSSIYVSPPWGFEANQDFYNSVIKVQTKLEAQAVLSALSNIEKEMGRLKNAGFGYESRIIDLDILDFDGEIIDSSVLTLPHIQMHLRKFVLVPLNEIASKWKHPLFKLTSATLLKRIKSDDFIKKLDRTND